MHRAGDEDGLLCQCSYGTIPARPTRSIRGREPRAASKRQRGQITSPKPWRCETPPGTTQATGGGAVAPAGGTRAPGLSRHHPAALSTSAARPCQQRERCPARARAPGRTCCQRLPQRLERGSGCSSRRVPRGHQPAPACRSCTGLKLSRELKPSPRRLRRRGAGIGPSQAGQHSLGSVRPAVGKTAGKDSPVSSSSHGSRSLAPGGAQQHLGQAHSPLHRVHNAAVIY